MADCVSFHARIASIIEVLANSAVAEICKLVDDGFATLRSQMEQEREKSDKENDALRSKLREMDVKMWSYQMKLRTRSQKDTAHLTPQEELGKQESSTVPATPNGNACNSISKLRVQKEDHPISKHFSSTKQKAEDQSWVVVKQERDECDLDLKVQVNITADCGLTNVPEPNSHAALTDFLPETRSSPSTAKLCSSPSHTTMDLTCRSSVKRRTIKRPCNSQQVLVLKEESISRPECDLKPDGSSGGKVYSVHVNSDETERLNGLGMDTAWMQERVSHLGAAYAVAQLGLGATEPAHSSSSFPSQASGENLDGPSSLIFPSSGHEIAAFAASFELTPTAAPAAASAIPTSQPYQTVTAKEPVLCQVCGRVFPCTASMELHKRAHTGERPYTCPHCGKGFAQPNNLRVHLLIHTGERRYRCTLCGKSFISSSHLKRHRTVHTQEKPYTCARCGQSFSQMCSVRRHRQQSQCGL